MSEFFTATTLFALSGLLCAVSVLVFRNVYPVATLIVDRHAQWTVIAVATGCTLLGLGVGWGSLLLGALAGLGLWFTRRLLPAEHAAGAALLVWSVLTIMVWLLWAPWFLITVQISVTTRVLLGLLFTVHLVSLPASLGAIFVEFEVLRRDRWKKTAPALAARRADPRKVSVHLACYNEPPDVVISTLDALSRLEYETFEVVVVDNNTRDPALWMPVRDHCARLGERFRFLHVDPWSGAKAGALNLALAHTAPDAALVAVVDADNVVRPDFLARLVGHFDDPDVGCVQTWYDFRDWQHSTFMTGCYWEYRFSFASVLRSYNERDAGFPIGTGCLFRYDALRRVGGWAPWCVTEDSELGIRLAAAGYRTLVAEESYGRGLVPETFAAYKKQRYRWTFGPSQAMRMHWRLLLPKRWAVTSRLTRWQKAFLIYVSLGQAAKAGSLVGALLALPALGSALWHGDNVPASPLLWVAIALGWIVRQALRSLLCRRAMGCSWRDTMLMPLMSGALSYTVALASAHGFVRRRTQWRHTRKFPETARLGRIVASARAELLLSAALLLAAGSACAVERGGLLFALELWLLLKGLGWLTAPVAAALAERGLRMRTAPDSSPAVTAVHQPQTGT